MTARLYRLPAEVIESARLAKTIAAVTGEDSGSPLVNKVSVPLAIVKSMVAALATDKGYQHFLAWGGTPGKKWAERTVKYNENHDPASGQFSDGSGGGSGTGDAARSLAAAGGQKPLTGLPQKPLTVNGKEFIPGPNATAREAARQYMQNAGLPYNPPSDYVKVDPANATNIANAYDAMAHDPTNPQVAAAYDAMIKETIAQYGVIEKTGLKVDFIAPGAPDPYAESPRMMQQDVRDNNHMWVFPTVSGFGSGDAASQEAMKNNPLLAPSGLVANGHAMVANDVFRVVHDYFGHFKEGNGFRAVGEENAWRSHSAMYTPLARQAMTSETRGQNSWVNYGPHGATNRTASGTDTVYAPQKIGLMPAWTTKAVEKYNENHDARGQFSDGSGSMTPYRNTFGTSSFYDPKHFTTRESKLVGEDGAVLSSHDVPVPLAGSWPKFPLTSAQDGVLYRGMSAKEYAAFQQTGQVQTAGAYNMGDQQKGLTYFTTDPQSAASYSNGFAPAEFKPSPGNPAYVVGVKTPSADRLRNMYGQAGNMGVSDERGVVGSIPASDVVSVHRGDVIEYTPQINNSRGERAVSASATLLWTRVDAHKYNENHDARGQFSAGDNLRAAADAKWPRNPLNERQHIVQTPGGIALLELAPAMQGSSKPVHVSWMQATPQGAGVGTAAMRQLTDLADQHGAKLDLFTWDGGHREGDLKTFYGQHGFKPGKQDPSLLVRAPKAAKYNENHDARGEFSSADSAMFVAARDQGSKHPGFLDKQPASALGDHQLLLGHGGKVGVAVSPNGDIQNVFNNGGPPGAGADAVRAAIAAGGDHLNAFDGKLPAYYQQFGFKEIGRVPFNPSLAPSGWNTQRYGTPDIVHMALATGRGSESDLIAASAQQRAALTRATAAIQSRNGGGLDKAIFGTRIDDAVFGKDSPTGAAVHVPVPLSNGVRRKKPKALDDEAIAKAIFGDDYVKFNPNHDARGLFSDGAGGGAVSEPEGMGGTVSSAHGEATKLFNQHGGASARTADAIIAGFRGGAEAIKQTQAMLAATPATDAQVSAGGFKNPDGSWTVDRQALHAQILDKIFTPNAVDAATPVAGQSPTLTVLGGRGGSGKSFLTGPSGPVDPSKAIMLDSDAVKAMLPGYAGWNAQLYHEESTAILDAADQRATALGVNVIHDATMKSEGTLAGRMTTFQAAGYNVSGHYMFASPEVAAERAMTRFAKGGTFSGRYVPVNVVLGNVNNEKNFDRITPGLSKWSVWDNNATGGTPRLVAQGGK